MSTVNVVQKWVRKEMFDISSGSFITPRNAKLWSCVGDGVVIASCRLSCYSMFTIYILSSLHTAKNSIEWQYYILELYCIRE